MTATTTGALTPFDITGELPTGTVLLEASAGTGKTWTIAALVTRYVAEGIVTQEEQDRFLAAAERVAELQPGELDQLNVLADPAFLSEADLAAAPKGLF